MSPKEHKERGGQKLLRVREVAERLSLSRSAVYELVQRGALKRPCHLTPHRVGWPESDVDEFIERKIAERDEEA